MKKLTQYNYNITDGSSFGGLHLNVSLQRLLEVFGQPTAIGSGDDKTQLTWVFSDSDQDDIDNGEVKCFAIYDWKQHMPIYKIKQWNVGRKGISRYKVHTILVKMGLNRENEIDYLTLDE